MVESIPFAKIQIKCMPVVIYIEKKKLKNKYIIVGFRIQRLDLKASYMYSHYIYIYFPFINQWWILNIWFFKIKLNAAYNWDKSP